MQNKDDLIRCAMARMSFLSCGERINLANNIDNIAQLALLSKEELESMFCRPIKAKFWDQNSVLARAQRDIDIMKYYSIDLMLVSDKDFPPLLREISQVPYGLYCRGNRSALKMPSIGVVGTRHPTGNGIQESFSFSKEIASLGYSVVSGLALGIDTAAHKGALQTGITVAVCGCGLDTIYPSTNKKLAAAIIQNNGCLVSEYAPEVGVKPWQFPERNRIISGLSSGIIVIEAPEKSGALITVDFALEQGRDVFFHPAAVAYAKLKANNIPETESSDVFVRPKGVLRFVEEGAIVVGNPAEVISLSTGGQVQTRFVFE